MKVSDVQHGDKTILELISADGEKFGSEIKYLSEAKLSVTNSDGRVLLRIEDSAWEVRGSDEHQQSLLKRLITNNLPKLTWVVSVVTARAESEVEAIIIEVREFPSEYIWHDPIDIGVDEKVRDLMRKKRKKLVSINDLIDWLKAKVLIHDFGDNRRIILSGSHDPNAEKRSAFRIHGKGIAVDIARDSQDRLIVTRVVESRQAFTIDEKRPMLLVNGQFRFVDSSIAGSFRGTARHQLDQLVEDADSYLGLWKEFNEIERQAILRGARKFGSLQYSSCKQQPNGDWRFGIGNSESFTTSIQYLLENEVVELEASKTIPVDILESGAPVSEPGRIGKKKSIFAGECVGFNQRQKSLDIRLPDQDDDTVIEPPEKGFLFISLAGNRTRLKRREDAQSKIASAECPMPQLGLLIEGKVVPERRRKKEKPLSTTAREAFGGEPTIRQIEALDIALNTPDIALIQGPPGTGKTRIIAALQSRLAEISDDIEGITGRYLLTSYQHDAVENVASATQVFGLPAIKVGHRRGQIDDHDGFERWRKDRVEAIGAQLATINEAPANAALQHVRDRTLSYLRTPSRVEKIGELLDEVREWASPHVSSGLIDDLIKMKQTLRHFTGMNVIDHQEVEQAVKAARGLRVDSTSFNDDGPVKAIVAMKKLDGIGVLNNEIRAVLTEAADMINEASPELLNSLNKVKQDMLDRLIPDERPLGAPLVNADVESVLSNVVEALHERVRSSRGGVGSVLHDYKNDLENDRRGTREAIENYTVVLASTCQQAVGRKMELHKGVDAIFDTVVVDEAARANPLDLFIPMSLAEKRIILVGDHRQLPHILENEIEQDLDREVTEVTKEMLRKSLFERLFKSMKEREKSDGIKRTVTLDKQYRMNPILGKFVSDTFYNPYGEPFESGRNSSEFLHGLKKYGGAAAAWINVPLSSGGERQGRSKRRAAEAKWIAQETLSILKENPKLSVGIISFYAAQVDEIYRNMEKYGLAEQLESGYFRIIEEWRETRDGDDKYKERLRVGTVDAFQGKEFDVVILSMTRSNDYSCNSEKERKRKYGYLILENRLCVAMSRQKKLLITVGDAGMLAHESAEKSIPGFVRFYEFCKGEHGVLL